MLATEEARRLFTGVVARSWTAERNPLLATSLSVLLPVHNAQAKLVPLVSELLEVLPELTPHWDILVVDDASTDATSEVAHELARHYPQVNLLSLPHRLGGDGSVRVALKHATGDALLVRHEDCRLDLRDIHKLWRRVETHEVVVGAGAGVKPLGWLPRLPHAKSAWSEAEPGLLLIRRRLLEGWRTGNHELGLDEYLRRRQFTRCEVELRERAAETAWDIVSRMQRDDARDPTLRSVRTTHSDQFSVDHVAPKQPNYLARIKAFALGE